MRDRKDMYTPASTKDTKWFRPVLMSCSYYACSTRLDIACPAKRLAQKLSKVIVSAVDEMKRVLRYLNGRPNFTLVATRPKTPSTDIWDMHVDRVDADLAGEAPQNTKSRTGSFFPLAGLVDSSALFCAGSGVASIAHC